MIERFYKSDIKWNTLSDIIKDRYPDFKIRFGSAPMDMDVTNGVEIETFDNSKHGYEISVNIYPFVRWTDGCYKPVHYWGSEYYVCLSDR